MLLCLCMKYYKRKYINTLLFVCLFVPLFISIVIYMIV